VPDPRTIVDALMVLVFMVEPESVEYCPSFNDIFVAERVDPTRLEFHTIALAFTVDPARVE